MSSYGNIKYLQTWVTFANTAVAIVMIAADAIKTYATLVIDIYLIPFGVPFERAFREILRLNYMVVQTTFPPSTIGGFGNGVVLADSGHDMIVQCAKCGIEGHLTVDGRVAFSIAEGLTAGELSLVNREPLNLHAIFGITLRGKWVAEMKELVGSPIPLTLFTIPGLINIGPQLSVSTALSFYLDGQAEFLL